MKRTNYLKLGVAVAASLLLGAGGLSQAGTYTWNMDVDPTTDPLPLVLQGNGINQVTWEETGGVNDSGFLALTRPIGGQTQAAVFPSLPEDGEDVIVAFQLSAMIRSGNSTGDRAADGWSVSLMRAADPVLQDVPNSVVQANFAGGIMEGGGTTGIAISFDTWSGNTYSDGADIEGLLVRVDDVTVLRQALPTRHGACDDATSLQTGPRDPDFWADTVNGNDPYLPESYETLCWQPLVVTVDEQARVTVSWKGEVVLEDFQTAFFPSRGQVVLAGRTGGANSHVHFDDVSLTTTTAPADDPNPPTVPGNVRTTVLNSASVGLEWDPSVDIDKDGNEDPDALVAYEVTRDGAVIPGLFTATTYTDTGVLPGQTYNYSVVAIDLGFNKSAAGTVSATTPATSAAVGFLQAERYSGIGGTQIYDASASPAIGVLATPTAEVSSGAFDTVYFINGLNTPNGIGDNYFMEVTGTITPLVSGNYRFFVRSDDASEFHINGPNAQAPEEEGPSIPNARGLVSFPVAVEQGCCGPFEEPGAGQNPDGSFPTSEPIALQAGSTYGFSYLLKEGGGGDWGQVAWRLEGDTTPANQLQPISGVVLRGAADPIGATITITEQPQAATVIANQSATLSVTVDASTPYNVAPAYQWRKDGNPIPGANGASLAFPVVSTADAGSYSVRVLLMGVDVLSDSAALTVEPDTKLPIVNAVDQLDDTFTQVTVAYDEPLASAGTYTLDNGATVSGAALSADGFTVTLTTSQLMEDTDYGLLIEGATDNGGNVLNTSATFASWGLVPNRAKLQRWDGFSGAAQGDIDTVLADASYPDSPAVEAYAAGLDWPDQGVDNFMMKMTALIEVPESGQWRFFIRSDDAQRLFLSSNDQFVTDETLANAIAREDGCCGPFEEVGNGANGTTPETYPTSEPISLVAGQKYALTSLTKEGGGGDWAQVAMRMEGDTTAAGDLTPITTYSFWYGPKVVTNPGLSYGRDGDNIVLTYDGIIEEADDAAGPYTAIQGATSPHTVAPSGAMKYYRSMQ